MGPEAPDTVTKESDVHGPSTHFGIDDDPTPPNKTPSIEEFKMLSLSEMLTRAPILQVGGSRLSIKARLPRICCVDGTSLSVQAGCRYYSHPRSNFGPYTAVEVGFPSETPPLTWKEYAEEWEDDPTNTIYAYVPLELVSFFIAAHGGIDVGRTFKGYEFRP